MLSEYNEVKQSDYLFRQRVKHAHGYQEKSKVELERISKALTSRIEKKSSELSKGADELKQLNEAKEKIIQTMQNALADAQIADRRHRVAEIRLRMTEKELAQSLVSDVAERHQITTETLLGYCRNAPIFAARMEAYKTIMERFPHWALAETARFFRRDHTTIMSAKKRISKWKAAGKL